MKKTLIVALLVLGLFVGAAVAFLNSKVKNFEIDHAHAVIERYERNEEGDRADWHSDTVAGVEVHYYDFNNWVSNFDAYVYCEDAAVLDEKRTTRIKEHWYYVFRFSEDLRRRQ